MQLCVTSAMHAKWPSSVFKKPRCEQTSYPSSLKKPTSERGITLSSAEFHTSDQRKVLT